MDGRIWIGAAGVIMRVLFRKGNDISRGPGGYMTVEAVLILPFVLGVIFLVIYMWFFKYDRCLMEQDYGTALVSACCRQGISSEERVDLMVSETSSFSGDIYLAWNRSMPKAAAEWGRYTVWGEGYVEFPFAGLNFWGRSNVFDTSVSYKGNVIKKMMGIRVVRKIEGIVD